MIYGSFSRHRGSFVGPGTLVIGKRDPARRVMSLADQLAGCKKPTATLDKSVIGFFPWQVGIIVDSTLQYTKIMQNQ